MTARVVVVGGGLAGITAALDLAEAGTSVVLLEARPRLGGAAYSIERDGLVVDNGQHVFLRCCDRYRALLHRLGATADTELQARLDIPLLAPGRQGGRLRRDGLPAPLHLARSLLGLQRDVQARLQPWTPTIRPPTRAPSATGWPSSASRPRRSRSCGG